MDVRRYMRLLEDHADGIGDDDSASYRQAAQSVWGSFAVVSLAKKGAR